MAWEVDPMHSQAAFLVKHMMFTTVRGQFTVLRGTINIDLDNLNNSFVDAEVDAASLDTHDANRDGHLRSADFFDAENYPTLHFKSTRIAHVSGSDYKVTGDLTIRGVTKEVVFDAEYADLGTDPFGMVRAGVSAKTKINRKDWGLTWNKTLEKGGVLVAEDVRLEIELAAVRK
jgi:polyisoprenoid-binding protein YceI